jgi:hypothetical protein
MLRRTVLQWLALVFPALRAWAQTSTFPGNHAATLRELARIVLPSELGRAGTDRIATDFEKWVRNYRPGAEMEHGYGFTRLRSKSASAAPAYLAQLEALREPRRETVEAALAQAGIKDLPRAPDGKHVITDLMSFYFQGSDANDLCYRAAIRRDSCRGLEGSENAPPPMKGPAQ